MLDELEKIDTSAIEELSQIKEDQLVLRDRLGKMKSKKAVVSNEVFARVGADYESRHAELEDQARPLKEQARSEYAKLRAVHEQCRSDLESARLSKEELEFRHDLGEYTEDEFNQNLEDTKSLLEKCTADLADAESLIERFVAAFHTREELEAPDPPVEDDDEEPETEDEAAGEAEEAEPALEEVVDEGDAEDLEPTEAPVDDEVPHETMAEGPPGVPAAAEQGEAGEAEPDRADAPAPPPVPEPPAMAEEAAAEPAPGRELDGATVVAGGVRLVAKHEDGSEVEYTIGLRPTTIGRAPGNMVEITGDSVSRQHAEITLGTGGYVIRDLETRNGTWVNGQRIPEEQTLQHGDLIQIGTVVLAFKER